MKSKFVTAITVVVLVQNLVADEALLSTDNSQQVKPKFLPTLGVTLLQAFMSSIVQGLTAGTANTNSTLINDILHSTAQATQHQNQQQLGQYQQFSTQNQLPSTLNAGIIYRLIRLDQYGNQKEIVQISNGAIPIFADNEKFAISFVSNLPGEITLYNIDPQGIRNELGKYTVMPGIDNRYPRDVTKGMYFKGSTGIETIKMDFYPCLTQQAIAAGYANAYSIRLPMCSNANYVTRNISSKAVANQELDAMTSIAITQFNPNEVVSISFKINHIPSQQQYLQPYQYQQTQPTNTNGNFSVEEEGRI